MMKFIKKELETFCNSPEYMCRLASPPEHLKTYIDLFEKYEYEWSVHIKNLDPGEDPTFAVPTWDQIITEVKNKGENYEI